MRCWSSLFFFRLLKGHKTSAKYIWIILKSSICTKNRSRGQVRIMFEKCFTLWALDRILNNFERSWQLFLYLYQIVIKATFLITLFKCLKNILNLAKNYLVESKIWFKRILKDKCLKNVRILIFVKRFLYFLKSNQSDHQSWNASVKCAAAGYF